MTETGIWILLGICLTRETGSVSYAQLSGALKRRIEFIGVWKVLVSIRLKVRINFCRNKKVSGEGMIVIVCGESCGELRLRRRL